MSTLLNSHTHLLLPNRELIFNAFMNVPPPEIYFSAGIHPKDSDQFAAGEWKIPTEDPQCIAIGEIGLDKIIDIPLETQLDIFRQQVEISESASLPVILHCVKAWNEVAQLKKQLKPKQTWVFHGFRKISLLKSVLQEGLMISIGTAILWDERLQSVLPQIPDDKLLLETDDDPNYTIAEVYRQVAKLKSIPLPALETQLLENFKNTFQKWEIGSSVQNS